ncbi:hypothetical protein [Pseudomonas sp. MH9.2]|uniref:hypothetical protein n=1 Tax=Pseudomonas sp. MH9.2 TaxID=3048629 RepID=UPI002AC94E7B|nr:hypothetical protein [Pseudomonas sp. MH9.2]WPX67773.1 hypothetical protein RHM55_18705 [Pseudomonas sp. MH9.2]
MTPSTELLEYQHLQALRSHDLDEVRDRVSSMFCEHQLLVKGGSGSTTATRTCALDG